MSYSFSKEVEKKPKKFHILIHTPLPPFLSCKGYARLKHHSDHTQFKWNCNGKFYGSYNLIFFLISMKILNKSILVEDSKGQSKSKRFYSQYSILIFALITIIITIMFWLNMKFRSLKFFKFIYRSMFTKIDVQSNWEDWKNYKSEV